MPRARVPHASFIASAELPILPFLAPRVFAQSPIPRRNDQQYGKKQRTQKEEANTTGRNDELRAVRTGPAIKRKPWGDATCAFSQRKVENTAGGLLPTTHSRWRSSGSTHASSLVDLRYADISTFARQYIRSYRAVGIRPRRVASQAKRTPQQAFNAKVAHKPSVLNRRGPLLASRREKALVVERERLANYIAHELDPDTDQLLKQGQYRSLRRRIANLEHWDETQLDLYERRHGLKRRFVSIRAFAALDRKMYPIVGRHTRKIFLKHDPKCARWSASLFQDNAKQGVEQTWENWMALDVKTRQGAYQRLLVYLLDRKPARAIQFIHALANDLQLRGQKLEDIADALGYLAKIHSRSAYGTSREWSVDKEAVKRNFVSTFVHIFRKALSGHWDICSQDLLYSIVDIADTKDLKKVFDSLVEVRTFLGFDTVLHYANAFARGGDIPSALRCLQELKAMNNSVGWEVVSSRERFRWTCALILRMSMSKNQDYHETPGIVAEFVRLGITMDIRLYNVVMHNAMEAGDYATAFKVYNALDGNGLKADKHTYSILLHGCTSQSDPGMFSQFAQHCADVAEETKDPWLAADYLHYLYICQQNGTDEMQSLALLQQAYLRFFTTKPLELISNRVTSDRVRRALYVTSGTQSTSTDAAKHPPPPVALYIMVQAGIQRAIGTSNRQVLDLYQKFRLLVQEGSDPSLTELASHPTIWNAFLLAFCKTQQFASASGVLKHMTNDLPQPNIYSWNIFMQAFFKAGQVEAGERVFKILRSRGVHPDQFTNGILLRGYAKAQHIERIGEIMQHVEAEQEMEPDLLRTLAHIANRNELMLTLEKSRVYKENQVKEKARVYAEEEKARWTAPRLALGVPETDALSAPEPVSKEIVDKKIQSQVSELDSPALQDSISLSTSEPEPELEPTVKRDPEMNQEPLIKAKSTNEAPPASKTPPSPPPQEMPLDPSDPEIQYRKLQEQLGLLAPSLSDSISSQSKPINPFGASLGFKSVDDIDRQERQQSSGFRVRKISPGTGSKQ
jgi:pentatricopeptide repeat protein